MKSGDRVGFWSFYRGPWGDRRDRQFRRGTIRAVNEAGTHARVALDSVIAYPDGVISVQVVAVQRLKPLEPLEPETPR